METNTLEELKIKKAALLEDLQSLDSKIDSIESKIKAEKDYFKTFRDYSDQVYFSNIERYLKSGGTEFKTREELKLLFGKKFKSPKPAKLGTSKLYHNTVIQKFLEDPEPKVWIEYNYEFGLSIIYYDVVGVQSTDSEVLYVIPDEELSISDNNVLEKLKSNGILDESGKPCLSDDTRMWEYKDRHHKNPDCVSKGTLLQSILMQHEFTEDLLKTIKNDKKEED